MCELLNVTFTAADAVRGHKQRPYIVYELRVSSSITGAWIILKRYNDFSALNEQLRNRLQTESEFKGQKNRLPAMPEESFIRRRFHNMNQDFIEQRQAKLQEYIRHLLRDSVMRRTDLVMDFLNVPNAVRQQILSQTPKRQFTPTQDESDLGKRAHVNEDELEVDLLLKQLYQGKDRVKALKRFERWYYLDRGPDLGMNGVSMHPHLIRKLLKGYDRFSGLIQSCKQGQCKTAWRGSLSLLCKLLDVERNKFARMFQQVFLNLDHSLYREMDLQRHIKDSTQEDGFQIVALIQQGVPRLDPTVYVSDPESWIQYVEWTKIQRDSYVVSTDLEPEQRQREQSLLNVLHYELNGDDEDSNDSEDEEDLEENELDDDDHGVEEEKEEKKQGDDDGAESGRLEKSERDRHGFHWRKMARGIFEKYEDFVYEEDEHYKSIAKVAHKYESIGMEVKYKKEFETDDWRVKISFECEHEPEDIFNFLRRSYVGGISGSGGDSNSNGWDKKLIDRKVVTQLDADHFIMHEVYKSFNSPYKFRDFLVMRLFREQQLSDDTKKYFVVWSSITNYNKMPESAEKLRCVLYPSGFEIRPFHSSVAKKSRIVFRLHLTSESVNIVTADLLGETDELFQSMMRISALIHNYRQKQALLMQSRTSELLDGSDLLPQQPLSKGIKLPPIRVGQVDQH